MIVLLFCATVKIGAARKEIFKSSSHFGALSQFSGLNHIAIVPSSITSDKFFIS